MKTAVVLALVLAARVAHADGEAEKLYQEGQAAYDARDYSKAIAAWTESYKLSKLPALVFNLAQAHRLSGHCTRAVEAYQRFLVLDPSSDERPSAEQFLRELEPCPAKYVKIVPDYKPFHYEDPGAGKRRAGIIIGGAGIAAFATGLYFGSRATSLANDVDDACAAGCEWSTELQDKESSGKRAQTIQYVLYAVGAAGVIGGAALYLFNSDKRMVFDTPKGGGALVGLAGRF